MSTTAPRPAVQSGQSSPLSASDAAQLAAWYARYALDRLGDDPRPLHQGARSHLAAACLEHEAAAKAVGLEHDQVLDDGHGAPRDRFLSVNGGVARNGRLVVAEDHHPEGGLGSAVGAALLEAGLQQLRLAHLCVSELPASGTPAELLAAAGIDAEHIASAAAALIEER